MPIVNINPNSGAAEINAAGDNVAFFDTDKTDIIEAMRERLAKNCPAASDIWTAIEDQARAEDGIREALRAEAGQMQGGVATGLYSRILDLQAQIAHFDGHDQRAGADAKQVARNDKRKESLARLKAKREQLLKRADSGGPMPFLFARINQWAITAGRSKWKPVHIAVPDDAAKAAALLKKNLAARADFLAQRREVEVAPVTADEARASFREYLEREAAKGAPKIGGLFRNVGDERGKIAWADTLKPGTTSDTMPDIWHTLLWACKDQIAKAVEKQISALADKTKHRAVARKSRPAMLAEFNAKLSALEYEEGALYRVIEDAGEKPKRRADISIPALLGIEVAKASAATEDFG